MVLWGVTDSIGGVPAMVGIVVHPACPEVLTQVSVCSTIVVGSKVIQDYHFLGILLYF